MLIPQSTCKKNLYFPVILLFGSLFLFSNALAENQFTVSGKVSKDEKGEEKVQLALLKFIKGAPKGTPPMVPVGRTETDKNGDYRFEMIDATPEDLFVVGILFEGKRESSESFRFNDKNSHTVNFTYNSTDAELMGSIQGKITIDGKIAKNARMVLIRKMPISKDGKTMEQVQTVNSDENGMYEFKNIPSLRKDIYFIGVFMDDDRYSSNRLTFETEDSLIFNISIPGKVKDAAFFKPERRTFVISYFLDNHSLKITDFMNYQNTSGKTLDLRENPIVFNLPQNAVNPTFFPLDNPQETVVFENGIMKAGVYSDSPTGQIVFEYDITADVTEKMLINMALEEGTKIVELIYPVNTLRVSFANLSTAEIIKEIGKKTYGTRSIEPKAGQTKITLSIDTLPVRQKHVVMYVSLLFVPLGIAVFVYLRRKKNALPNG